MSSPQHAVLQQLLVAATGPLAERRPQLPAMRLFAELLAFGQFMPWNVFLEDVEVEGIPAEWVRPAGAVAGRVLLYLHGGGYVLGSLNTHRSLVGRLAQKCGVTALAINYRKAPEYPFPAALEDALTAYFWLLNQGYAPADIIVAGDSAGGGLALALLLALRDADEPLPAAAVGLSPWTDLQLPAGTLRSVCRDESLLLEALEIRNWGPLYAAETPLSHPLISPARAELHGLPPLLLQVSDAEVLSDDVRRFAERARAAGTPTTLQIFDGLVHWWHLFWRFVPEADIALDRVADFTRQLWSEPATATDEDRQAA
ncbi:alpha/beta hydrolase [Hymenobacter sp. ISL-91]|uniref:alpha/beta hydrolase fold domain-containing protein n=1 Tax=Hymenobacter sp. ISL-91 TaxID=2819151 RepID=UPI001BE7CE2E|nr:alpha/beta hydrolase [Hymenobacter sp. ISL-91]MBT2559169.1 alpha/beta hydrolase [Hymenobacter sp. ISL-91]